jgi:hypothetical protein
MSTETLFPAELMARMQEAAENAAKGVRDPEASRQSCDEMDRMREELRKRIGTVNMAVDLIRDVRDR